MRRHTGERPFKCEWPGCGYAGTQKHHLETHMQSHSDERPFKCDSEGCGKSFKLKSQLGAHMRIHTGEKRHGCKFPGCGKAFRQSGHLDRHMLTHADNKEFKCTFPGCEKAFNTAIDLKVHARVHSGEKPYKCTWQNCEKAFAERGKLTIHMRFHTGEKPYKCTWQDCENAFARKDHLTTHMRTHTDERPFVCQIDGCAKTFRQHSNLMKHLEIHHNNEYIARKKQEETRIETALTNADFKRCYKSGTIPPVGQFTREHNINFRCDGMDAATKYCRIDFVISLPGGLVFLEVDEHQHRFGYDSLLSCDQKRMGNVMEALAIEARDPEALPNVVWIRYNPHAWRVGGELQKRPKAEREAWLVNLLQSYEPKMPLGIAYAFYDCDADGSLEVLQNEHYSPHYAEVSVNLTPD